MEEMLNMLLSNWLRKYGFETSVCGQEESFGYYEISDTIAYTLTMRQTAIDSWERLMEEQDCPIKVNQFYTSFLHELGHAETLHWVSEEERAYCEDREIQLANMADISRADFLYYHLPREIIATQWAMRYMRENIEAIRELVETTAPLLEQLGGL